MNKIQTSLKMISNLEGRVVVNFSGGRDSLTVLLLAKEVTDPIAWYMETDIDLPGTIEYVTKVCDSVDVKLIVSHPREYQGGFYDQVKRWGYFPTLQKPWCNTKIKIRPQRAKMRKLWGMEKIYKLTGIRIQESARRLYRYSNRPIEKDPEHSGSFMVHPILEWSKSEVLTYLKKKGYEEHTGYKICGVSGCFWCPWYQHKIFLRINAWLPGIYSKILDLEKTLKKPSLQGHVYLHNLLKQTELTKYQK